MLVQELLLRNTYRVGGVVMSARESEIGLLSGQSKDPSRKLIRTIHGAISEPGRWTHADSALAQFLPHAAFVLAELVRNRANG